MVKTHSVHSRYFSLVATELFGNFPWLDFGNFLVKLRIFDGKWALLGQGIFQKWGFTWISAFFSDIGSIENVKTVLYLPIFRLNSENCWIFNFQEWKLAWFFGWKCFFLEISNFELDFKITKIIFRLNFNIFKIHKKPQIHPNYDFRGFRPRTSNLNFKIEN